MPGGLYHNSEEKGTMAKRTYPVFFAQDKSWATLAAACCATPDRLRLGAGNLKVKVKCVVSPGWL